MSLAIDVQCRNEGSGEKQSEQNIVKNNFCASGDSSEITISDLENLQQTVQQDPSIRFGLGLSISDRAPLQALGEGKLVTLKAFVLEVRQEGGESVNCGSISGGSLFHDIHISLVDAANRPQPGDSKSVLAGKECSGVVVEMTPHHRPDLWTANNIKEVVKARALVRVTGQQFFDSSHRPCANGMPDGNNPKRISLWEIHPVYEFEVCTAACRGAGQWLPLDQWVNQHQGSDQIAVNEIESGRSTSLSQKEIESARITNLSHKPTSPISQSPTQTTPITGSILGNKHSMIYHWPGCPNYDDIAPHNRVPFQTREEAEKAGYRAARNCP